MKPPVKNYRTVECNPHELSTIREENNTPMSERTIKRSNSAAAGGNNVTNSLDISSGGLFLSLNSLQIL